MAFLGTSHGRVYRVGPLGTAGSSSSSGIASGPMHKPQGLADYLPWRIRGENWGFEHCNSLKDVKKD